MISQLLFLLAVPLLFALWLSRRTTHHRGVRSQSNVKSSWFAVGGEVIALAGLCVAMLTTLAMYRQYNGVPYPLSVASTESAASHYWQMLFVWGIVVAIALLLAMFRRFALAVGVVAVLFVAAGFYVNEGYAFSPISNVEQIRQTTVPLTVTVANDVVGAEVKFNGVVVGTTPCQLDYDQTLASLPDWNNRANVPEQILDSPRVENRFGSFRQAGRIHLQPATKVLFDDKYADSRSIYATVELNGQPMIAPLNVGPAHSGSRVFGQIKPASVELNFVLPEWLEEIGSLIDRARCTDYKVDEAWIAAANSYGDELWPRIQKLADSEPGISQVLDQWSAHDYKITDNPTDTDAWAVFETIQSEANQNRGYHTATKAGHALEQIVPRLNVWQVVKLAEQRLNSFRTPPSIGSLKYGGVQQHFGNHEPIDDGPTKPADLVIAHAISRLDHLLDQQDDTTDNLIEQRITPALMRFSFGRTTTFTAAEKLGGSIYERFILRHDWRMKVTDDTDSNDRTSYPTAVNRWLYSAANLQTPEGESFRRRSAGRLLQMAEKIVRESGNFDHSFSNDIDFLFLNDTSGAPTLAIRFWKTFDQLATPGGHFDSEAPDVRWEYLRRLGSFATVKQFVDSYRPYCDERFTKHALEKLPPELRFEVLTALIKETKSLLSGTKQYSRPNQIRTANLQDFESKLRLVPNAEAAELFLQWAKTENRSVEHLIKRNRLSPHHLKLLAQADEPRLREVAFKAARAFPTPANRAALKSAPADELKKFNTWMDELLESPLPHRQP